MARLQRQLRQPIVQKSWKAVYRIRTVRPHKRGAAADEVDNLQPIAIFERSLGPTVAGDDVTIEFDGDAVGFHGEGFYQSGESGNRRIEGPFFPVDLEFHDV